MEAPNQTPFRISERKYKRRVPPPDYSDLVDFQKPNSNPEICLVARLSVDPLDDGVFESKWTAFSLDRVPGLMFIPNPFTRAGQQRIIYQALSQYTRPPNISNLDAHWHISKDGLWQQWVDECDERRNKDALLVKPKRLPDGENEAHQVMPAASDENRYPIHQRKENQDPATSKKSASTIGSDEQVRTNVQDATSSACNISRSSCLPSTLIRRLRWVTLGFQYDWFTKEYVTNSRFPFPSDFATICQTVVAAVDPFLLVRKGAKGNGADMEGDDPEKYYARRRQKMNGMPATPTSIPVAPPSARGVPADLPIVRGFGPYYPEAGIVNFYQLRDTLTAHVDRSEENMEAPLVSLSFGHSCVFLIGGASRDTTPVPILLRSGDILVLSGEARRAFHGVPRIIEGSLPPSLLDLDPAISSISTLEWSLCQDFLQSSRINMNARQVFFHEP